MAGLAGRETGVGGVLNVISRRGFLLKVNVYFVNKGLEWRVRRHGWGSTKVKG